MKAIAVDETGKLAIVDGLPEPDLPGGHVLIRMLAGGVCGSDLTWLEQKLGRRGAVRIIGHEGGGKVVAVADDVTTHQPGDVVVVEPNYPCLQCERCQSGQTKLCSKRIVVGRDVPGLFAELVAVPARFAWKVRSDTPREVLASFEAAMVARVAVDRTDVREDEAVLVVGAGSQGQCVIASLLELGIKPTVSEPNAAKLDRALAQGARDVTADPVEEFAVVFETSGAGLSTAVERAAGLGRICLIGQSEEPVPLATRAIVQKELAIQGSLIYNHPTDFAIAVRELEEGHFYPAVGMRPPAGPGQAVEDLKRARALDGKIWIDFSRWSA